MLKQTKTTYPHSLTSQTQVIASFFFCLYPSFKFHTVNCHSYETVR